MRSKQLKAILLTIVLCTIVVYLIINSDLHWIEANTKPTLLGIKDDSKDSKGYFLKRKDETIGAGAFEFTRPLEVDDNFQDGGKIASQTNARFRRIPHCTSRFTGVEDILCMQRPKFLPHFRNPCWYQDGRLRCLPYFHIIGVCKSGTTDLFRRMSFNKHVLTIDGVMNKEAWYWSWLRYGEISDWQKRPMMRLDWFIDRFNATGIEHIKRRDANYPGGYFYPAITGHGDPMDFWDHSTWKMIPQNDPDLLLPEVTTPSLIKHVNPDVKLILVLRDPIQRLYSHYLFRGFGSGPKKFHSDVISTMNAVKSCRSTMPLKACLYDKKFMQSLKIPSISASFYSIHLSEWLRVFPRHQMLIIRTEDFAKDVSSTLKNVFHFLQLEPPSGPELSQMANLSRFFETPKKKTAGPIQPDTLRFLQNVFQPFNKQLAIMLNDTRFLWDS